MTVIVAKDNKVVGNFALLGPGDVDAPKILEQLAAVIDGWWVILLVAGEANADNAR